MNPFDDENARFKVLVNGEGQHCIWPSFAEVPTGWTVRLLDSSRPDCMEYIEAHWVDMRPKSLIAAMQTTLPDSEKPSRLTTREGGALE